MSYTNKPKGIGIKVRLEPTFKQLSVEGDIATYVQDGYKTEVLNKDEIHAETIKAFNEIIEEMDLDMSQMTQREVEIAVRFAIRYDERLQVYTEKPTGRTPKWEILSLCLWYDAQKYLDRNTTATMNDAFRYLSNQPQWERYKDSSLRSAYQEYVKKALWFDSAEQMGLDRFAQMYHQITNLKTRSEVLESSKAIHRIWPCY